MAAQNRHTDDGSTPFSRRRRPSWIVPGLLLTGLVLAIAVYILPRNGPKSTYADTEPTPAKIVSPTPMPVVAAASTVAAVENALILVPTNTPVAQSSLATATPVTLPTVTPSPVISSQPVTRSVTVSGTATLRMEVEGNNFASTGQPLALPLPARSYVFANDSTASIDSWCLQLGLVNLWFDLSLHLKPETAGIQADGQIQLRNDFCSLPGSVVDTEEVSLEIPADATVRLSYLLRSNRSLLEVSGLLDTKTNVLIELILSNRRPLSP